MTSPFRSAFLLVALSALLTFAEQAASAEPILYTMTFDASNVAAGASGPSGTGSFLYDADTDPDTMTSLIWDFGSGQTGGVTDANLAAFDNGQALFIHLNNPSTSPFAMSFFETDMIGPFPDLVAILCWETNSSECGMAKPLVSLASYRFTDYSTGGEVEYRGYVTVEPAAIPEPSTLALLGLGLAGMGVRRWRQRKTVA